MKHVERFEYFVTIADVLTGAVESYSTRMPATREGLARAKVESEAERYAMAAAAGDYAPHRFEVSVSRLD